MVRSEPERHEAPLDLWPLEAEREFWRDVCSPRRHPEWYWWFLVVAMGYGEYCRRPGNVPWLTDRVHRPLAAWIQEKLDRYIKNMYAGRMVRIKAAVELPRGTGKTQSVTIPAGLALTLEFPDLSWGNGSESIDKAAEMFLDPQRAILEGEDRNSHFVWLFGQWLTSGSGSGQGRRPSRKHYLVHNYRQDLSVKDKSLFCWGVGRGMTSKHPGGGSIDDPVSEETLREEANWLVVANNHMDSMFYAFLPNALVFFPHTRYRVNDPAGERWRKEGIKSWSGMPCPDEEVAKYIRPDGQWDVYFLDIRGEDGNSILPEIYPTEELDKMEASDPIGFAAQMRNQPGTGTHQLITREQVREMMVRPEEIPLTGRLWITCDTAFKDFQSVGKGDHSVATLHLEHPTNRGVGYYLEGFGDNRHRIETFTDAICRLVYKIQNDRRYSGYELKGITDEITGAGKRGSWFAYLRQYAAGRGLRLPPLIDLNRGGKAKTGRVVRAIGYWLDGRYFFPYNAPGAHNVISQAVRYYEKKNQQDDWIDAAADFFDSEIYRAELHVKKGAVVENHDTRRRERRNKKQGGMEWDEDAGIYDTWEPQVVR